MMTNQLAAALPPRWRDCPGAPGYKISDLGHVRGKTWNVLVPIPHTNGYRCVTPYVDGKRLRRYVHELVLTAFVGPRPPNYEADHLDLVRANNALTNLRWLSVAENRARRILPVGEAHYASKLSETDVRAIIAAPPSVSNGTLAAQYGVSREQIRDIRSRKYWRHINA